MSGRLNWARANKEKKKRVQGIEPIDDLLPCGPDRVKNVKKRNTQTARKQPISKKFQNGREPRSRTGRNRVDRSFLDLMNFVADSIVCEQWVSDKTPKSITRELAAKVTEAGGLLAWANAQSEFESLLDKKKRKKLKREAKNKGKVRQTNRVKVNAQFSEEQKRLERIRHLRSEIAQAEEFIRLARKEIARLD